MIKALRLTYTVSMLCRVLDVAPSGYYAWIKRRFSNHDRSEMRLELEIRAAHKRTRQTYVPERLQRDLADNGIIVGVHRIKRIRKKLGLHFEASAPNQTWLSDITYIPTGEGWLYLAGHKDLFTGEIVGYATSEHMTKNLVIQSLLKAFATKKPASGLMHHSDRGSQYCAWEYASLLDQCGMTASMGRAMTMLRWKVSGVCSKTNRPIIVGMQPDKRL